MNFLQTEKQDSFRVASAEQKIPKIRIRGLEKSFGSKKVLAGVDLDIYAQESWAVIGGSGTGKSVLLKCILGIYTPDAGTIEINGQDLAKAPAKVRTALRAKIGMLFQNGALFDSLPVWENTVFSLLMQRKISRKAGRKLACEILGLVGLSPDIADLAPSELSGGMQKRVGLARAIAGRPEILFFDEPTTGLDPIMSAVIDALITERLQDLGSTGLAITHDMAGVRRIATKVGMLYEGKIIWQGTPDQLFCSGNPIVDQFTKGLREGPIKIQTA